MMRRLPSLFLVAPVWALFVVGCPSNGSDDTDTDTDADYVCDPVGSQPEMNELLNAPVADDVEVIQKTPRHPGQPGPEDLP